ncbi:hypothetical protein RUM44_006691 [Polyplax serrata]|uniref:Uncharacterized protein n=1 Tax=Polyplax serrata TaxID=468196 RepID=A0ABR1AJJ6_POLSC
MEENLNKPRTALFWSLTNLKERIIETIGLDISILSSFRPLKVEGKDIGSLGSLYESYRVSRVLRVVAQLPLCRSFRVPERQLPYVSKARKRRAQ